MNKILLILLLVLLLVYICKNKNKTLYGGNLLNILHINEKINNIIEKTNILDENFNYNNFIIEFTIGRSDKLYITDLNGGILTIGNNLNNLHNLILHIKNNEFIVGLMGYNTHISFNLKEIKDSNKITFKITHNYPYVYLHVTAYKKNIILKKGYINYKGELSTIIDNKIKHARLFLHPFKHGFIYIGTTDFLKNTNTYVNNTGILNTNSTYINNIKILHSKRNLNTIVDLNNIYKLTSKRINISTNEIIIMNIYLIKNNLNKNCEIFNFNSRFILEKNNNILNLKYDSKIVKFNIEESIENIYIEIIPFDNKHIFCLYIKYNNVQKFYKKFIKIIATKFEELLINNKLIDYYNLVEVFKLYTEQISQNTTSNNAIEFSSNDYTENNGIYTFNSNVKLEYIKLLNKNKKNIIYNLYSYNSFNNTEEYILLNKLYITNSNVDYFVDKNLKINDNAISYIYKLELSNNLFYIKYDGNNIRNSENKDIIWYFDENNNEFYDFDHYNNNNEKKYINNTTDNNNIYLEKITDNTFYIKINNTYLYFDPDYKLNEYKTSTTKTNHIFTKEPTRDLQTTENLIKFYGIKEPYPKLYIKNNDLNMSTQPCSTIYSSSKSIINGNKNVKYKNIGENAQDIGYIYVDKINTSKNEFYFNNKSIGTYYLENLENFNIYDIRTEQYFLIKNINYPVFYTKINFEEGQHEIIRNSRQNLNNNNNKFMSLDVSPNTKVTIYEENNYNGDSVSFTKSYSDLSKLVKLPINYSIWSWLKNINNTETYIEKITNYTYKVKTKLSNINIDTTIDIRRKYKNNNGVLEQEGNDLTVENIENNRLKVFIKNNENIEIRINKDQSEFIIGNNNKIFTKSSSNYGIQAVALNNELIIIKEQMFGYSSSDLYNFIINRPINTIILISIKGENNDAFKQLDIVKFINALKLIDSHILNTKYLNFYKDLKIRLKSEEDKLIKLDNEKKNIVDNNLNGENSIKNKIIIDFDRDNSSIDYNNMFDWQNKTTSALINELNNKYDAIKNKHVTERETLKKQDNPYWRRACVIVGIKGAKKPIVAKLANTKDTEEPAEFQLPPNNIMSFFNTAPARKIIKVLSKGLGVVEYNTQKEARSIGAIEARNRATSDKIQFTIGDTTYKKIGHTRGFNMMLLDTKLNPVNLKTHRFYQPHTANLINHVITIKPIDTLDNRLTNSYVASKISGNNQMILSTDTNYYHKFRVRRSLFSKSEVKYISLESIDKPNWYVISFNEQLQLRDGSAGKKGNVDLYNRLATFELVASNYDSNDISFKLLDQDKFIEHNIFMMRTFNPKNNNDNARTSFKVEIADNTTDYINNIIAFDTFKFSFKFYELYNFINVVPNNYIILLAVEDEAINQWNAISRELRDIFTDKIGLRIGEINFRGSYSAIVKKNSNDNYQVLNQRISDTLPARSNVTLTGDHVKPVTYTFGNTTINVTSVGGDENGAIATFIQNPGSYNNFNILNNNKNWNPDQQKNVNRGLNVVELGKNLEYISFRNFDTHASSTNSNNFADFLNNVPNYHFILIAAADEFTKDLNLRAIQAIENNLGSNVLDPLKQTITIDKIEEKNSLINTFTINKSKYINNDLKNIFNKLRTIKSNIDLANTTKSQLRQKLSSKEYTINTFLENIVNYKGVFAGIKTEKIYQSHTTNLIDKTIIIKPVDTFDNNLRDYYVSASSQSNKVILSNNIDISKFKVKRSLINKPENRYISLESLRSPNWYITHHSDVLKLQERTDQNDDTFKRNASFELVTPNYNSNTTLVSFKLLDKNMYMEHNNYTLQPYLNISNDNDRARTSFMIEIYNNTNVELEKFEESENVNGSFNYSPHVIWDYNNVWGRKTSSIKMEELPNRKKINTLGLVMEKQTNEKYTRSNNIIFKPSNILLFRKLINNKISSQTLLKEYVDTNSKNLELFVNKIKNSLLKQNIKNNMFGNIVEDNIVKWSGSNIIYNYCSNNLEHYKNKLYSYDYSNRNEKYYMMDIEDKYKNKNEIEIVGGNNEIFNTSCKILNNQDVKNGTFVELNQTKATSNLDCSYNCSIREDCTAWVYQPSNNNCRTTKQSGTIIFEQENDRTSGLKCELGIFNLVSYNTNKSLNNNQPRFNYEIFKNNNNHLLLELKSELVNECLANIRLPNNKYLKNININTNINNNTNFKNEINNVINNLKNKLIQNMLEIKPNPVFTNDYIIDTTNNTETNYSRINKFINNNTLCTKITETDILNNKYFDYCNNHIKTLLETYFNISSNDYKKEILLDLFPEYYNFVDKYKTTNNLQYNQSSTTVSSNNTYTLIDKNYYINKIINTNLEITIKNKLLKIYSDYILPKYITSNTLENNKYTWKLYFNNPYTKNSEIHLFCLEKKMFLLNYNNKLEWSNNKEANKGWKLLFSNGIKGLLDNINNKFSGAYALKQLFNMYSGPTIKVKTLTKTADIYFDYTGKIYKITDTNNEYKSVEEWTNETVYVEKWYDQSNNYNDITSINSNVIKKPKLFKNPDNTYSIYFHKDCDDELKKDRFKNFNISSNGNQPHTIFCDYKYEKNNTGDYSNLFYICNPNTTKTVNKQISYHPNLNNRATYYFYFNDISYEASITQGIITLKYTGKQGYSEKNIYKDNKMLYIDTSNPDYAVGNGAILNLDTELSFGIGNHKARDNGFQYNGYINTMLVNNTNMNDNDITTIYDLLNNKIIDNLDLKLNKELSKIENELLNNKINTLIKNSFYKNPFNNLFSNINNRSFDLKQGKVNNIYRKHLNNLKKVNLENIKSLDSVGCYLFSPTLNKYLTIETTRTDDLLDLDFTYTNTKKTLIYIKKWDNNIDTLNLNDILQIYIKLNGTNYYLSTVKKNTKLLWVKNKSFSNNATQWILDFSSITGKLILDINKTENVHKNALEQEYKKKYYIQHTIVEIKGNIIEEISNKKDFNGIYDAIYYADNNNYVCTRDYFYIAKKNNKIVYYDNNYSNNVTTVIDGYYILPLNIKLMNLYLHYNRLKYIIENTNKEIKKQNSFKPSLDAINMYNKRVIPDKYVTNENTYKANVSKYVEECKNNISKPVTVYFKAKTNNKALSSIRNNEILTHVEKDISSWYIILKNNPPPKPKFLEALENLN